MGNHIARVVEWVWSFKSEEQRRKDQCSMQCQWIQTNIKRFQKRIDEKKVLLRTFQRSLHHNQERLEKYRHQPFKTESQNTEAKHVLQEVDKLEKQIAGCYRIIRDVEQLKHGQETQLESLEMWEVLEETGVANSKAPDTGQSPALLLAFFFNTKSNSMQLYKNACFCWCLYRRDRVAVGRRHAVGARTKHRTASCRVGVQQNTLECGLGRTPARLPERKAPAFDCARGNGSSKRRHCGPPACDASSRAHRSAVKGA